MDHYIRWPDYEDIKEQQLREHLIQRLQGARHKLAPILDDVITSASELIKRGCFQDWMLTPKQYQDVMWAWQVLQECESTTDNKGYKLANVDVIVNNVSVNGRKMSVKDKSIIIDEATVLELLEIYQNMGVIIQRLLTEGIKVDDETEFKSAASTLNVNSDSPERSVKNSKSSSSKHVRTSEDSTHQIQEEGSTHQIQEDDPGYDEFEEHVKRASSRHDTTPTRSSTSFPDIHEENEEDLGPPKSKSTLSALIDGSSGDLQKQKSEGATTPIEENVQSYKKKSISYANEPSLFIKIKCFSDFSDAEEDKKGSDGRIIQCAKDCPSHYHVKLDGEPVTLKMNQNNVENGTVYCINTGADESDEIRIVIKQCPECMSTVVGCSTKIKNITGESHESITLHGKQGDEANMTYSSDESDTLKEGEDKVSSVHEVSEESGTKLDVVIDAESVDKSTVEVHDDEPSVQKIPMTRRRICSSMEFDVTTVHTRLRDHEIEHANSHVMVELKKLGVDQILRACRPAKCCRQAILNEKQKAALPYCVSLKSLPLMSNDIEVIKQSIDMSTKKIKNAMDLTQAYKDKLAFYVSLGRESFQPRHDYSWVVPVYDLETEMNENKFFVLKKEVAVSTHEKFLDRCIAKVNKSLNKPRLLPGKKKCFVLKKPSNNDSAKFKKFKLRKRNLMSHLRVRFQQQNNVSDCSEQNCFVKMCHQKRRIIKKKNIWSNIGRNDWRCIFAQDNKELGLDNLDFIFGQTSISKRHCYSKSSSKVSVHYQQLSQLTKFVGPQTRSEHTCNLLTKTSTTSKTLEGGDCLFPSLGVRTVDNKHISNKVADLEFTHNKLVSPKSTPNFCEPSDDLYCVSSTLTVYVRRSRSLAKCQNVTKALHENLGRQGNDIPDALEGSKEKTKLQYYVALVNGDLVWSNRFPLEPQKVATFYNHSNETLNNPPNTPVEDPMYATRISPGERPRPVSPSTQRSPQHNEPTDRRSTISELSADQIAYLQGMVEPSQAPESPPPPTPAAPPHKFPESFSSYSLGPESYDESWAPLVVSDQSLPRIHEEITKQEVPVVESRPAEATPPQKPKNECSGKSVCVRNKCSQCRSKPDGTNRKCFAGDIKINIHTTKDSGIRVQGKGAKSCNKEICEIYKNKNLVPDKTASSSKSKDGCQNFTISAKENIEIYINNKKISLGPSKSKKSSKESSSEKKKSM